MEFVHGCGRRALTERAKPQEVAQRLHKPHPTRASLSSNRSPSWLRQSARRLQRFYDRVIVLTDSEIARNFDSAMSQSSRRSRRRAMKSSGLATEAGNVPWKRAAASSA